MKKSMVFATLLMVTLLFQARSQLMIINMNGHPHSCDDALSDTLNSIYTQEVTTISDYISNAIYKEANSYATITFPERISSLNLSLTTSGSGTFSIQ